MGRCFKSDMLLISITRLGQYSTEYLRDKVKIILIGHPAHFMHHEGQIQWDHSDDTKEQRNYRLNSKYGLRGKFSFKAYDAYNSPKDKKEITYNIIATTKLGMFDEIEIYFRPIEEEFFPYEFISINNMYENLEGVFYGKD